MQQSKHSLKQTNLTNLTHMLIRLT